MWSCCLGPGSPSGMGSQPRAGPSVEGRSQEAPRHGQTPVPGLLLPGAASLFWGGVRGCSGICFIPLLQGPWALLSGSGRCSQPDLAAAPQHSSWAPSLPSQGLPSPLLSPWVCTPPPGSNLVSRPTATASSLSGCRGNCVGQSSCSGSDAGERELTADPEAANGDAETE